MKYLYTPQNIAVFFLKGDFTLSDERAVIIEIWEEDKAFLPAKYRKDFLLFEQHIYIQLSKLDSDLSDLNELNILMHDTSSPTFLDGSIDEEWYIENYFKIIRLFLTHVQDVSYRKIKLRTLLRDFGYKRRSAQLIECIRRTLVKLELKTYLRDYIPCNISEIDIDDMVMIRIKQ